MTSSKKNKEINHNNLVAIKPITDNQKIVFDEFKKNKNQFLFGAAGTGKTFCALYLDMQAVMDLKTPYEKEWVPQRHLKNKGGSEERDEIHLLDLPVCALHEILLKLDGKLNVLVLTQVHWDQLQF